MDIGRKFYTQLIHEKKRVIKAKKRRQEWRKNRWEKLHQLIQESSRICLCTHINSDGDGLGSQIAMAYYLKKVGKEVRIINPSPVAGEYRLLKNSTTIEVYNNKVHDKWLKTADLVIAFDLGDSRRINELGASIKKIKIPMLSIDHHNSGNDDGYSIIIHDSEASATGYLVWEFLQYCSSREDGDILSVTEVRDSLYIALMTDTGSFRFSNTSSNSHNMASDLVKRGSKPYDLYKMIYESRPVERMKLLGKVLGDIHLEINGKVAWSKVTLDMFNTFSVASDDTSGFADILRSIKGVEVAFILQETSAKGCKLSFRSRGKIRVDKVAKLFGGGGHSSAAGAFVGHPMAKAEKIILNKIIAEIESQLK